jgi:hypothetical protein
MSLEKRIKTRISCNIFLCYVFPKKNENLKRKRKKEKIAGEFILTK